MEIINVKEAISVQGADVSGSTFRDANMEGAEFRDANLERAVFEDINLRNASFSNINFSGAKISMCDTTDMSIDGILVADLLRVYNEQA